MKRNWCTAVLTTAAAGLVISLAAGAMVSQNRGAMGPVATIDVVRIFNEYQRQKDLTEEMKLEQDKFISEGEARRQKVDAVNRELQAYSPDDPAYLVKQKDLFAMQIDNKNWAELKQAMMTGEVAVWTRKIYQEIVEKASRTAESRGFDVVLYRDEFPPPIRDPDEIRNIIRQRKLIYSNPAIDLTDEVLAALNAAYRAKPAQQKMLNIP